MKNKKGFTLIELLAVVVVLVVVSIIAIPIITGIVEDSRKSAFATNEKVMVDAARNAIGFSYFTDRTKLEGNEIKYITLKELIDVKTIDVIKDPKSKKECDINNSKVYLKNKDEGTGYNLIAYLVCENYESSIDFEPPVIELSGSFEMEVYQFEKFVDPGYVVTDNKDKEVKVSVSGEVNTDVVGEYYITYSATDSKGNSSSVKRKVTVIGDTEAPKITLKAGYILPVPLVRGAEFDPYDYIDIKDNATPTGDLTKVAYYGSFNNKINGDYDINISVKDRSGNEGTYLLKVYVKSPNIASPKINYDSSVACYSTTTLTMKIEYETTYTKYKKYKIGNGEWQDYTGPFSVSTNGYIYAKSVDEFGNESNASSFEVKKLLPAGYTAICTAEQFNNIRNSLNSNYMVMSDIDLSGYTNWTPISSFAGVLDGNGYKITGLKITGTSNNRGLFDSPVSGSTIKNLTIENANISGGVQVGILIGINNTNITIENVHVSGNVTGTQYHVGGLIGNNSSGKIKNSSSSASITSTTPGAYYIGGLVGYTSSGTIENSSSTGNVRVENSSGTPWNIGGLVGYSGTPITNSSATGNVTVVGSSAYYIGGLVGQNGSTVSKSYASGSVTITGTSTNRIGGLIGYNGNVISESYASGNVSANDASTNYIGGLVGQNQSTITKSYATGNVTGGYYVGGLSGYNSSVINTSYASGNVTGIGYISVTINSSKSRNLSTLGGLIGYNYVGATLTDVYALGNVTGSYYYPGGLIGLNLGTITKGYSIGKVSGTTPEALIGYNTLYIGQQYTGTYSNLFFDKTTSGISSSGYGTAKTTTEMQTQSTFTNFDFTNTWKLDANSYPTFR